ncbi:MAG: lysophospholipase [Solirubrobacteraceae bacterium]
MTQKTTDHIDGTRGRLAVHRWIPGDPRAVVVLAHGYGEHAGRYDALARHLAGRGLVVVAPDHAGHGESEGERALITDFEDVVTDLDRVTETVRDAFERLPRVLLGHSLGGIVATRLAQRNAAVWRGLALSGPVIGGNPDILALIDLDPIPEVPIDPATLSRDPAVGEAYAADPLVYHGAFRVETLRAVAQTVADINSTVEGLEIPLLWLHGEEDGLAPLDVTRAAVSELGASTVEQHVYPGARHEVFNETNRDEVIGHLDAFIDRVVAD